MKNLMWIFASIVVLAACGIAAGQASKANTIASVSDGGIARAEQEFVPAADAMPEDKYSFAPSQGEFKGVRNFGQQIKHVAAVNYMLGAAILGEKPPVELGGENGPDSVKTKADILKFLKDSFAYAHKATNTITAQNAVDSIKSPFGEGSTTRLAMASLVTAHVFDHYGQMVEYLRMNGIIPPASR